MRACQRAITLALIGMVFWAGSAHGFAPARRVGGLGARFLSDKAVAGLASLKALLDQGARTRKAATAKAEAEAKWHDRVRAQAAERDARQQGEAEQQSWQQYERRWRAFRGRESRTDMLRRVSYQAPSQQDIQAVVAAVRQDSVLGSETEAIRTHVRTETHTNTRKRRNPRSNKHTLSHTHEREFRLLNGTHICANHALLQILICIWLCD